MKIHKATFRCSPSQTAFVLCQTGLEKGKNYGFFDNIDAKIYVFYDCTFYTWWIYTLLFDVEEGYLR